MALKTDVSQGYTYTLKDPEDGTEYSVTYRRLTYGDLEERRDVGIKIGKKGQGARFSRKAQDFFTIHRSVISWDIPFKPTAKELETVEPWLPKQIFEHLAEVNPNIADELKAFDADEDEDSEAEDVFESNGHTEDAAAFVHAPETEVDFGESEGPTKSAAQS